MNDHLTLRAAAQSGPKAMINTTDLLALLADYDALLAAGVPKRKAAAKKAAKAAPELPAWLPLEAWEAFLAMRVKIKKPATDYAQKLLLGKLSQFRERGLAPEQILNQSIENSGQDLYAPKNDAGWGYGAKAAPAAPVRTFRQQQQDAANQEALDRLAGRPTFDPTVIDVEATYVPG